ncbi:Myosin-1 [Hibiscus syriacus]|uniref:Myosin-1 n=1 Tax=Hibiscus syriacus TaxID=106335 RepID=A0A6A3CWX6_HIBSY|nr:Myosin-1 [Hibiscus syriacus]
MFSFAKSSLEEMLESLRQRDDGKKPKDQPPALPSRPPSRARVISGRWTTQPTFNADGENGGIDEKAKKNTIWGNKRTKDVNADSPYYLEDTDNIGYFIEKKLRVWCRQSRGVWAPGIIEATSGEESFVSLGNETVAKVSTSHMFPANPEILDGVDDLMHLSYLNEPSVLHNLKCRYYQDMIYSKAGAILIAVNPFKDVEIYGKDFVTAYKQKATDSPHVFAIADTAYNEMMNGDEIILSLFSFVKVTINKWSKSISDHKVSWMFNIFMGNMELGKPRQQKFAMQYLVSVGGVNDEIESQLLQASCILEAFGNAKTSRNDNASRFGKLVEIHFTEVGEISGAKIQTFLLEKTRVVELETAERSFHIFYQLCAGAPQSLREKLYLKKADEYNYLAQSDCLVIKDVDDAQEFQKLTEALDLVQISKEEKDQMFKMLAAVLWLGNISFQLIDKENHVEASNDEDPSLGDDYSTLSNMIVTNIPWIPPPMGFVKINVDAATTKDWKKSGLGGILKDSSGTTLGSFKEPAGPGPPTFMELKAIQKGLIFYADFQGRLKERLIIESDSKMAVDWVKGVEFCPVVYAYLVRDIVHWLNMFDGMVRWVSRTANLEADALAKEGIALIITARLLGCASHDLNQALSTHKAHADKGSIVRKFTLQQKNGFEQLCINYANERLQQHFNRHLLKLEQEEYELDGIDGVKVDFVDNQDCLDLFEKLSFYLEIELGLAKKPIGLLSLLDEESNSPDANDSALANKLKQQLSGNSCFKGDKGRAFGVRHFAGEVFYDTNGFMKKNQDTLNTELIELLSSCEGQLPQTFAIKMLNQYLNPDAPKLGVGTQLKGQLLKLMHQLENTKPHFVCCIKPNRKQLPSLYDEDLVLQQLRCCGILEVVRISRSGYPARMTHEKFAERYGSLLLETNVSQDPLSISVAVLKQFNVLPEMHQIGYTKLYLRVGQIGALEDRRKQALPTVADGEIQGNYSNESRSYSASTKEEASSYSGSTNEGASSYSASGSQLLDEQLTAIIELQSEIRGSLVRKHLSNLHALRQLRSRRSMSGKNSKVKDVPNEQPSAMADLQKRVLDVEATLGQKEQENATLREQLQQYDEAKMQKELENATLREQLQQNEAKMQKELENATLREQSQQNEAKMQKEQESAALREQLQQCEVKMQNEQEKKKKMEETLQKQIASLQESLAAAKKSDASDGQLRRSDNDSKDNVSVQPQAPGGNKPDAGGRESGLSGMAKEFEQQKQTFEDDMNSNVNSYEELRKLKHRFRAWKKDYKMRLREMKAKHPKQGHKESDKSRKKWWPKRGKVLQMQTCNKPTS